MIVIKNLPTSERLNTLTDVVLLHRFRSYKAWLINIVCLIPGVTTDIIKLYQVSHNQWQRQIRRHQPRHFLACYPVSGIPQAFEKAA